MFSFFFLSELLLRGQCWDDSRQLQQQYVGSSASGDAFLFGNTGITDVNIP
jgi:hypothetical protein